MRGIHYFAISLPLVFSATLLCASNAVDPSVEMRSPHYLVSVAAVPGGDSQERFAATVTDVVAAQVFSLPTITVHGALPGESALDANGVHFHVRVSRVRGSLSTVFTATDDHGTVVDSLEGNWIPREDALASRYPYAYRVGHDVKAPIVIGRVEPSYTDDARKARIAGIVILEVMIDEGGVVRDVSLLKGLPFGLSKAAEDAVRQWTFRPATLHDRPVASLFNLTINYRPEAVAVRPPD